MSRNKEQHFAKMSKHGKIMLSVISITYAVFLAITVTIWAIVTIERQKGIELFSDYELVLIDDGYMIDKYTNTKRVDELVIPDDYFGVKVVSIGDRAFMGSRAKKVVIGENINYIGANAFTSCTTIETLVLKCKSLEIGRYAFSACTVQVIYNLTPLTLRRGSLDYGEIAVNATAIYTSLD